MRGGKNKILFQGIYKTSTQVHFVRAEFALIRLCLCQVPLLIPCHRVISSSGQSGPYMSGKGDHLKQWLLTHERQAGAD